MCHKTMHLHALDLPTIFHHLTTMVRAGSPKETKLCRKAILFDHENYGTLRWHEKECGYSGTIWRLLTNFHLLQLFQESLIKFVCLYRRKILFKLSNLHPSPKKKPRMSISRLHSHACSIFLSARTPTQDVQPK